MAGVSLTPYGYNGKIARVNLGSGSVKIEEHNEGFYQKYLGGRGLGAYFLFRDVPVHADALGPDNEIIYATSIITGIPIAGMSRFSIVTKSPLTGTFGETEAGGYFGAELKAAGFDALIVENVSEKPVYLWLHDEQLELRDASHLWGKTTKEAQAQIRRELDDSHLRIALIGPAGENLVRFACVLSDLRYAHGRGGIGAVMGSKKLKGIAVKGRRKFQLKNPEEIQKVARKMSAQMKEVPGAIQRSTYGTADMVLPLNAIGLLPTRNFQGGSFVGADNLSGERMKASILKGTDGCFACPIRCKREVSAPEPFESDAAYGGPEYETIASFGSLCEVADLGAVSKAHELCNAYGLDTISTGSVVAFAMECYENSLLTDSETGGMQLRFGNTEAMLQLVEMIAYRKGIGNILADGVKLASEKIGKGSARFALHVKGKELPMHDPRGKKGVALGYAVSPSGADHMQAVHDPVFVNPPKSLEALGIFGSIAADSLGGDKVRAFVNAHLWWGLLDCLGSCKFVFIPHNVGILDTDDRVELVNASTGFNMSLWSLMKASERALNLTRCFNVREGFTAKDDKVPERLFEGLRFGNRKGAKLEKQEFDEALRLYYGMMGWDSGTGTPTAGKLHELDLEWVTHEMDLA